MSGKITIDGVSVDGSLFFSEQTSAVASIPGMGQLWVKSGQTSAMAYIPGLSTSNTLWFTNDAGTDVQLGVGGAIHQYVDRGDPSAWDFQIGDLTTDGTWRDLDLSSIVPSGAVAVHLYVLVQDDSANKNIKFRKNGNANNYNVSTVRSIVANQNSQQDIIVSCDSNRIVEYKASNTSWTQIIILVKGWWT